MQFSEDDLRRALRRKTPSPDFAQRVLAKIESAESKPVQPKLDAKPAAFSFRFWPWSKRMTLMAPVAAFAAMLVVAVGLLRAGGCEPVSVMARTATEPLRIVNRKQSFVGMADEDLFAAHIRGGQRQRLAYPQMARLATIDQARLLHVNLLDLGLDLLMSA